MPSTEQIHQVIREWVAKAENDLTAARVLQDMGEGCPADIVCFHAQQCVEKYLKAVLVLDGAVVPKTHDVERIVSLLPSRIDVGMTVVEMRLLTGYAVEQRYPGYGPITLDEAREAVELAYRVRLTIQAILPLT